MTTITLELPDQIQARFKFGSRVTFDDFTRTVFGEDFILPDLTFTPLSDLSADEKSAFLTAKNHDPARLVNL